MRESPFNGFASGIRQDDYSTSIMAKSEVVKENSK